MSFKFTTRHIQDYHERGYTVFRDIIPAPLLSQLRREADKGRPLARIASGPNAQRLQPLVNYPEIDMAPFRELALLPGLVSAINSIFEVYYGHAVDTTADLAYMGVLYEPENSPRCMRWHRDFRDLHAGINVDKWREKMHDIRFFNQTNVALYRDSCLWAVPGSHLRLDTPDEIRRFPLRPVEPPPNTNNTNAESAEYEYKKYVMSMPGAEQIHLDAGDYLLYRNSLWHTGFYLPYQKRATIHGTIITPEYKEFFHNEFLSVLESNDGNKQWQNPNAHRPGFQKARFSAEVRRFKNRLVNLTRRCKTWS